MAKTSAARTVARVKFRLGRAAYDLTATLVILREADETPDLELIEHAVADILAFREELRLWQVRLCGLGDER